MATLRNSDASQIGGVGLWAVNLSDGSQTFVVAVSHDEALATVERLFVEDIVGSAELVPPTDATLRRSFMGSDAVWTSIIAALLEAGGLELIKSTELAALRDTAFRMEGLEH